MPINGPINIAEICPLVEQIYDDIPLTCWNCKGFIFLDPYDSYHTHQDLIDQGREKESRENARVGAALRIINRIRQGCPTAEKYMRGERHKTRYRSRGRADVLRE